MSPVIPFFSFFLLLFFTSSLLVTFFFFIFLFFSISYSYFFHFLPGVIALDIPSVLILRRAWCSNWFDLIYLIYPCHWFVDIYFSSICSICCTSFLLLIFCPFVLGRAWLHLAVFIIIIFIIIIFMCIALVLLCFISYK